jgi:hypothetical protein
MSGRDARGGVGIRWSLIALPVILGLAILLTLGRSRSSPRTPGSQGAPAPFVNVASEAGIQFQPKLSPGPLSIRDTAGSGGGFVDYDQDGDLDVVLLGLDRCALYRNQGGGRFTDVTAGSGLPQKGQWIGCAAGDFDDDGLPDLFLNGYGCTALLHNRRGAGFEDVTAAMGLGAKSAAAFGTSAVWGDYDGDGWLDLYVARYLEFRDGMAVFCRASSGGMETCNPDHYRAQTGSLYRNHAGRRFEDVTHATGADRVHGKTWGTLFFDYDEDGWQDLYLANDVVPGDLLKSEGGKRFRNVAMEAGAAYDADGRAHAGMGIDSGDYDGDGRLDMVVTTFFNEAYSVYRNNADGTFTDRSATTGVAIPTLPYVGWGTRFFDYDRDGWPDLLFVNGHATDRDRYRGDRTPMCQPPQLLRNEGGSFRVVPLRELERPILGRGSAFGDYDNDGDTDVLVLDLNGPALLLRNESPKSPSTHWLGLVLRGRRGNREAIGARVTVKAGGRTQVAEVRTGGGLFSSHDPRLLFGLGSATSVDSVTIRWPDGRTTTEKSLPVDTYSKVSQQWLPQLAAGAGVAR